MSYVHLNCDSFVIGKWKRGNRNWRWS